MKTASTSLQLSNLNLPSTRSIFFVVDISECVFIRVRHFSVRIVLRVFWHTGMMVVWSMLLSILMKRSLSSASPCHHACVFSLPVVSPYLSLIPIGRFQPTSSLVVWWLARSTLSLLYGMPSNWNAVDLWHSFGIVLWIQLTWIFLSFSILGIDRVYSFEIIRIYKRWRGRSVHKDAMHARRIVWKSVPYCSRPYWIMRYSVRNMVLNICE